MPLECAACQVCGRRFPADQLWDVKGNVPGGCKVTCAACIARLEERELCAKLSARRISDCEGNMSESKPVSELCPVAGYALLKRLQDAFGIEGPLTRLTIDVPLMGVVTVKVERHANAAECAALETFCLKFKAAN